MQGSSLRSPRPRPADCPRQRRRRPRPPARREAPPRPRTSGACAAGCGCGRSHRGRGAWRFSYRGFEGGGTHDQQRMQYEPGNVHRSWPPTAAGGRIDCPAMRGGRRSHRSGNSGRHGAKTDRTHRGAEAERHVRRSSRARSKPEPPWTSLEDVWGETSNAGSPSPADVERSAVPVAAPADIWGSGDIVVDRSAWGPRRPEDLPPRPEGAPPTESSAGPGRPGGGGSRSDLSRLARGGSINLGGAVANGLFGFLLVLVVTRGLIPAAAGVFFEAIALFQILGNITQLGA